MIRSSSLRRAALTSSSRLARRRCTRADILNFQANFPAALSDVIAHRGELQWKRLLIMGRDPGVESDPHNPLLAKSPSRNGLLKTLILQQF